MAHVDGEMLQRARVYAEGMMDMNWKNIAERAAWTFVQGALSVVALEMLASGDVNALKAAAIGGVAALLSLVKTIAQEKLAA